MQVTKYQSKLRRMRFQKVIAKYKAQSEHYFSNAVKSIEAGNAEKASEFLWGSMAQALKAVAARKGTELNGHRELGKYASELAKELRSETMLDSFHEAELLHRNFYNMKLGLDDVRGRVDRIKATVDKLIELALEKEEAVGD